METAQKILADYIVGPAHAGFVVRDLEVAIGDACRVYGVDPRSVRYVPEPGIEAPTRFAFFSVGGLEFEYIQPDSPRFQEALFAQPSGGGGINHIAWAVRDIHAAVAALAVAGIEPGYVTPDGIIGIGEKKMVYLDPATTGGLLIELIETPP